MNIKNIKTTEHLQREIRRLKMKNAELKKINEKLSKQNDRLSEQNEILDLNLAESQRKLKGSLKAVSTYLESTRH